uniref:uncharacterized protein LOC122599924 n=1 Tax=Erigeron canadensis TaxID=72917 RepID=UPI001CB9C08D|nr:uncharacterized protein LOC122599924 [Erigeron canadensis]
MSWRRANTPGWAAYDPKNKQKQVTEIETHDDPFPPISRNTRALHHGQNQSRNGDLSGKSFFSVLTHSTSVPDMVHAHTLVESSQSDKINPKFNKLNELYPRANEYLMDILAAVDYDIDKASKILTEIRLQDKEAEFEDYNEEVGHTIKNNEQLDDHYYFMMDMSMIPVEPEWEDDDMYIIHRKEAIRAMRLASRHKKAATEAYLRGDHAAAREYSLQAREEWYDAKKLNAKAAKEILAIRNPDNDDWKLDLHGLHATEAVQFLLERLTKIESQMSGTHPAKPDKTDKMDRQEQIYRPRLLEVITGIGNHSRGEAALPVAIKSFLSEKRYYHFEARIGAITVRPKFRKQSNALSST